MHVPANLSQTAVAYLAGTRSLFLIMNLQQTQRARQHPTTTADAAWADGCGLLNRSAIYTPTGQLVWASAACVI
eukprot:12741411-Alexandrium_andersonii.AAC.1